MSDGSLAYSATLYDTNCVVALTNMTASKAGCFWVDVGNAYGYAPSKQVCVAVIAPRMETNGFALTIRGLTNSVWRVDVTTNLGGPANWLTLTNIAIPRNPPYIKYVDLEGTNLSRFYRVVPKLGL